MGVDKLKKETIGIDGRTVIVIVLVLALVIAVVIPIAYFVGQESEGCPSCVRPTYLIWECTNGTHNWTELQLVYASVYPDSYQLNGTIISPATGNTIEYHTYCELSWEINYKVIE